MLPEQLNKKYKRIYISVSGFIDVSNLACQLIDTEEFQRLRQLHQLGTAFIVFPSAGHSRFDHSLGTYELADRLLRTIKDTTPQEDLKKYLLEVPELVTYFKKHKKGEDINYLDDWVCELIKLAALAHDIGHGPFSHVYDDYLHLIKKSSEKHEDRTKNILEKIMVNILSDDEIKFIKSLIDPPSDREGFLYEIVCNNHNSIDVDKLDYLRRDTYSLDLKESYDVSPLVEDIRIIDNKICYPVQLSYPITNLFTLRYRLHKQICSHKTVVSTQFMILDILKLIDHKLDYDFKDLTDYHVLSIPKIFRIKDAEMLLNRINKRDFYKCVERKYFRTKEDRDEYYKENIEKFDNDSNFKIYRGEIGMFPKKIEDPFKKIYFYKRKNPNKSFLLEKDEISFLLPEIFKEYYVYLFKV